MKIVAAEAVDDEILEAWTRLLPQLSRTAGAVTASTLEEVVHGDSTSLLLARDGSGILGALTLAVFPTPTGRRAWIEDVVVDSGNRGRGIGEALVREAVSLAGRRGARTLDLTSRPTREAANRLYQRTGFVLRETNAYRHVPEGPRPGSHG